jgi:hypothetical protein
MNAGVESTTMRKSMSSGFIGWLAEEHAAAGVRTTATVELSTALPQGSCGSPFYRCWCGREIRNVTQLLQHREDLCHGMR